MNNVYAELIAAGCEVDHHESDLYVKNTDVARKIIEKGCVPNTTFKSDGQNWIEVPFAYTPFWEAAAARRFASRKESE